ncbi:MAG TPA: hypothetical protein VIW26_16325 [Gemmatimonadales bacterium]|jgi:DUF4097 and DUF4098 domain-containing protein YvlB
MSTRSALSTVLLLAAATALAAQEDPEEWLAQCRHSWRRWDDRARVCVVRETGFRPAGGTLSVDPSENGGVSIYGWDRDSIAVVARIEGQAGTESDAQAIVDAVRIEAGGRHITARGPDTERRKSWAVTFDVYVPRHTDLSLSTENGPLSVEEVTGAMQLRAINGPVTLRAVGGDVTARVQNGPLSVELAGARWDGAGLDAEAQNGPVSLGIPEGYNARLETGTVNGPMNLAFPLTVTIQGHMTNRIHTTLGDGGPPVRVVTTNGPLTIHHARS